jgi:hypothetical protein
MKSCERKKESYQHQGPGADSSPFFSHNKSKRVIFEDEKLVFRSIYSELPLAGVLRLVMEQKFNQARGNTDPED